MKRRLRKLVLFVFLGVYVNIAVAWLFAVTFEVCGTQHLGGATKLGPDDYWIITRLERLGVTYVLSDRHESDFYEGFSDRVWPAESLAPRWAGLRDDPPPWEPSPGSNRRVDAFGWPFRTLWCEFFSAREYFQEHTNLSSGGIDLLDRSSSRQNGWALPLFPIFPASIVNSSFYAAIIWIAWMMPGHIKRRMRLRRGLCPQCGYDLRGTAQMICSECGYEIRAEAGT